MFLDQRLFIVVFFLLFLLLLVFSIIHVGVQIRHNNKVKELNKKTQCFVINLEKNADRLQRFYDSYSRSDLSVVKLSRFDAINGKQLDLQDYVTNEAYKQIMQAESSGYRQRHYELTRGAVGCFLSHASLFKRLLQDDDKEFYLIFEDDAYIPPKVIDRLAYLLDKAPDDWDIIVFGVIREVLIDRGMLFDKVKAWWGLFGYAINKRGAQKFLDEFSKHKIDKQIDSMMSLMVAENKLNVYSSKMHLISHNASGTDIQLPVKVHKDIDPFKYENIELFLP